VTDKVTDEVTVEAADEMIAAPVINYYQVLEVPHTASADEIRRSFRVLVRKFHPDHNRTQTGWAERKLKAVLAAYKVLRDPAARTHYDARLRTAQETSAYRDAPISARATSPGAQASAVLFDLVNGRARQAVKHFEDLTKADADFTLAKYLNEKDCIDCKFLLAEEMERQGKHRRSAEFYMEVYDAHKRSPHMKYFVEELRDRIRVLYWRHIAPDAEPAEALECYRKLLRLKLFRNHRAFVLKKMAERYFELGDLDRARTSLREAFTLKPTLKGAQRICEKLGFPYAA